METDKKLEHLIGVYLAVLVILLLSVITMPLLIRHGFPVTSKFIIEEETLETILIVLLFAASYFILRGFNRALKAYRRAAVRAGRDKSRLISRLAEAFKYIGTVNVEFKEIQSILCGTDRYPRTKREFKQLVEDLAAKVMAVTGTPWAVLRIISQCSGRTIKEFAAEQRAGLLPSATMGNRAILEGRYVEGRRTIGLRQRNLDQLTVCIIPSVELSEEQIVLVEAITNQVEMLYMLHQAGCLHKNPLNPDNHHGKELYHVNHH